MRNYIKNTIQNVYKVIENKNKNHHFITIPEEES